MPSITLSVLKVLLSLLGLEKSPKGPLHKGISIALKLLIVAASCGYIYTKVFHRSDLPELLGQLSESVRERGWLIPLAVLLLVPVNWGIEAVKWKKLMQPLEALPGAQAFKAVLAGVAVSTVTPNRAGEFAGRVFFLQQADRYRATWLTFAGSAVQLGITLLTGAGAYLLYAIHGLDTGLTGGSTNELLVRVTGLIAVFSAFLALLLLLLLPWLTRNTGGSRSRFIAAAEALHEVRPGVFAYITGLSLLRYIVFSLQFALLLFFFGAGTGSVNAMILVPLTFFSVTVIPTVALSEVAVRGSAALLLFLPVTDNPAGVLAASVGLWCVNVGLPAAAGCLFVFRLRFFKDGR
jgi:hypothetical protein